MYCHPTAINDWAKAMKPKKQKPKPTLAQIEQARLMRTAKSTKKKFLERQLTIPQ